MFQCTPGRTISKVPSEPYTLLRLVRGLDVSEMTQTNARRSYDMHERRVEQLTIGSTYLDAFVPLLAILGEKLSRPAAPHRRQAKYD